MFHTQHQSRAHAPRNTQLSLTRSFSLCTTSLPTLSFPKISPENRPGQAPGTPAQRLPVQEPPRPSSPQSITPNKALRAVLFSTGGSVTRAIRPTHAGLAFSLSSSPLPHSRLPQGTPVSLRATPTLLAAILFPTLTLPKL
uniref:Uncharacterized protein n=1 Tax=Mesocestoides corti TaxID=53468 RepID=A0A5K3FDA7_MESCO